MSLRKKKKIKRNLKVALIMFIMALGVCAFDKIHDGINKVNLNNKQQIAKTGEGSKSYVKNQTKKQDKKFSKKSYLEKTVFKDSQNKKIVKNVDDILVLVNRQRSLPENYVPKDLVVPKIPFPFTQNLPKKHMRKEAALAIEQLFNEADKDKMKLYGVSGYRSYSVQQTVFNSSSLANGKEHADKYVAYPGESEHQTGLAMDVTTPKVNFDVVPRFENLKEGIWLKKNASRYGFIIRFPKSKEEITGFSYEPWHIRYVGKEVAQLIDAKNITLEEYLRDYK